jgi:Uma2 family endonuclease
METEALERRESTPAPTFLTTLGIAHQQPPATLAEYRAMPDEPPYYEFINGNPATMPAPTLIHQRILFTLAILMNDFTRKRNVGEVIIAPIDVYLSDDQYLQPDIVFVATENSAILGKHINGAPDIVVEVLSPSNGYKDATVKKFIYEEFGVREYWIVDPETRSVEVLTHGGAGSIGFQITSKARTQGVVSSSVLQGFTVDIATIFA